MYDWTTRIFRWSPLDPSGGDAFPYWEITCIGGVKKLGLKKKKRWRAIRHGSREAQRQIEFVGFSLWASSLNPLANYLDCLPSHDSHCLMLPYQLRLILHQLLFSDLDRRSSLLPYSGAMLVPKTLILHL